MVYQVGVVLIILLRYCTYLSINNAATNTYLWLLLLSPLGILLRVVCCYSTVSTMTMLAVFSKE